MFVYKIKYIGSCYCWLKCFRLIGCVLTVVWLAHSRVNPTPVTSSPSLLHGEGKCDPRVLFTSSALNLVRSCSRSCFYYHYIVLVARCDDVTALVTDGYYPCTRETMLRKDDIKSVQPLRWLAYTILLNIYFIIIK